MIAHLSRLSMIAMAGNKERTSKGRIPAENVEEMPMKVAKKSGIALKKGKAVSIEDAREVSKIVTDYFITLHPSLSYLHFRIHSIRKESESDTWVVICSFDKRFGSENRVRYELLVNREGVVSEVKELEKNED